MSENVNITLHKDVSYLLSRLENAGFEAYAVGGFVRDAILGREAGDCDITTSALPEEIKTVFSDLRTIDTGIKHGTVTVLYDGTPYEITTYRVDGEYADNRHPDTVTFTASLREDLARRDMNDAPIDESNLAELTSRMEVYISEFEKNGTDNVTVEMEN